MAIMMGVTSYLAVGLIAELVKVPNFTCFGQITGGVIGAILGLTSYIAANKSGPLDSWKTWSIIANSKVIISITLIFSFAPLIVNAGKLLGVQEEIPFILYMYWICGLSSFLFILLYNITAPQIFKSMSYKSFIETEGTLLSLRLDALATVKLMENKRNKNKIDDFEKDFFDEDLKLIEELSKGTAASIGNAESFYALKERSKYSSAFSRFFVAITMLIPAYLLPTIIVLNIFSVGNVAHTHVVEKGSLYNAVFNIEK